MATNKRYNVLRDMSDSKLRWCYKKWMKKDNLPILYTNVSYYSKNTKALLEQRDQVDIDKLVDQLLAELQKQSSTDAINIDRSLTYHYFKNHYGDPTSRSSIGRIYNNVTSCYVDGSYKTVKNDGWVLIRRLLDTAASNDYLPSAWVNYISTLMQRAKLIGGRSPNEMTAKEKLLSDKMFTSVVVGLKLDMDTLGEEPEMLDWDTESGEVYSVKLSNWSGRKFDYHCGSDYLSRHSLETTSGNHFGIEWELDFGNRRNYRKCIWALIKAGIMFDKDDYFLIQPMYDGSLSGGYCVEMIFAADTFENITDRLSKAKAIFDEYGVKSSTERNHAGIHVTQDFDYLKGNAFYLLSKYVLKDLPLDEYLKHTLRNPNGYCERSWAYLKWVTDGQGNNVLDNDRGYSRYYALNVDQHLDNRLEWRMFNACCDPVTCITWIRDLNEKFNAEARILEQKRVQAQTIEAEVRKEAL